MVICLVLFIFKKVVSGEDKYLLIIKGTDLDTDAIDKYIEKNTKYSMCKGKYVKNSNVELIYDVKLKDKKDDKIFNALKDNLNIDTVNLVANNTDTMG